MSNIIINNSSYTLTSNIDKPRLKVSNSYIPLTTKDNGAKVYIISNNSRYNIMNYSTSSSSSSTIQTTGYSGISSRQSYYYTTSVSPGIMSSITNLTRASTSATLTRASTYATLTRASTYDIQYLTSAGSNTFYTISQIEQARGNQTTYQYNTYCFLTVTSTKGKTLWGWVYQTYLYTALTGAHVSGTTSFIHVNPQNNSSKSSSVTYRPEIPDVNMSTYISNPSAGIYSWQTVNIKYDAVTTGTIYYTRQSIYGYATRESIYGYATRQSISGYAGSLSRQSNYYTSSTNPGAMSNITYLTSSTSESASTTTWV